MGALGPRRFCPVGAKSETATIGFESDISVLGHLYLPLRKNGRHCDTNLLIRDSFVISVCHSVCLPFLHLWLIKVLVVTIS